MENVIEKMRECSLTELNRRDAEKKAKEARETLIHISFVKAVTDVYKQGGFDYIESRLMDISRENPDGFCKLNISDGRVFPAELDDIFESDDSFNNLLDAYSSVVGKASIYCLERGISDVDFELNSMQPTDRDKYMEALILVVLENIGIVYRSIVSGWYTDKEGSKLYPDHYFMIWNLDSFLAHFKDAHIYTWVPHNGILGAASNQDSKDI